MNKLALIALSSVATLAFVAGCSSETPDEATESTEQDLTSATSAYTDVSREHPLDACTYVSSDDEELPGARYDCGGMGDYQLIAETYEETSLAPLVRTPSGTFSLDLWNHVNTYYGYHGKLAEWRGRGLAIGKVAPTALIMRVFTPGNMDHVRDFTGSNSLVVVKLTPTAACVHSVVSGATPNHNQIARDITDSAEFAAFTCPAATPEPLPSSRCGTLEANEGLMIDQVLTSCTGSHSLVLQNDGNLVIYNRAGRATWSSRTVNRPISAAIMRADGQFGVFGSALDAHFEAPTAGNEGAKLVMQDDGNLVVYAADGRALWSTGTQGK